MIEVFPQDEQEKYSRLVREEKEIERMNKRYELTDKLMELKIFLTGIILLSILNALRGLSFSLYILEMVHPLFYEKIQAQFKIIGWLRFYCKSFHGDNNGFYP
ncbi:MAG TPA: hypothetical protein ENG00_00590 [Candidatus Aenigmarchaeota archaeon]|nr:hypothetical protein [Candidatus Aenigmarchaeota archaeon]